MTLELIIFIASVLFGALLYWRESHGNNLYRFFNKLMYAKALQMAPHDKTGFLYQQKFIVRLVFIGFLFLVAILIARFLIPIDITTLSIFASMVVGTLLGTYLATFIFKSGTVIDEKSEAVEDLLRDTIEKGKEFIDDLKTNEPPVVEQAKTEIENETPKTVKSARDRLKDKGFLK